ncbi:phosphatase PAP2 family protein [Larkinella rosea]|uniref:Phosphatase PAP2 family protein n=1 Tax=Larkinella rosea TaxID=2025312 RepID=A0A3P1BMJ4_9BACT|nr:phosphatase PAP2 family protein [Larkinella rosea]RRB02006.1 phosphatase PAP2 family protein [Larkinella rosea]
MAHHIRIILLLWLTSFPLFAQTAGDSIPTARRFPLKSFIVPATFIGGGAALLGHPTRAPFDQTGPISSADEYLRFGPYGLRVALQIAGIKPAIRLGDEIAVTVLSNVVMAGATESLKRTIHSTRPDGSDRRSFPSGHAAVAFTGAELLHQAYKHKSPWISVAGYAMATATAVLRVANNQHHWADVLAGAGIGIASVKITYAVYPVIKRKLQCRHRQPLNNT